MSPFILSLKALTHHLLEQPWKDQMHVHVPYQAIEIFGVFSSYGGTMDHAYLCLCHALHLWKKRIKPEANSHVRRGLDFESLPL